MSRLVSYNLSDLKGPGFLVTALQDLEKSIKGRLKRQLTVELKEMTKSKKITGKKRNPQDATMRNVKASRKRFEALEARYATLEERVSALEDREDDGEC